jgi:hypothetical protein
MEAGNNKYLYKMHPALLALSTPAQLCKIEFAFLGYNLKNSPF